MQQDFRLMGKTFFLFALLFGGHTRSAEQSAADSLAQGTHSDSDRPQEAKASGAVVHPRVEVVNAHRLNRGQQRELEADSNPG